MKASSNSDRLDLSVRWGIEHRSRGGQWWLVTTLGTEAAANRTIAYVCGSTGGDWRIRKPERRAA